MMPKEEVVLRAEFALVKPLVEAAVQERRYLDALLLSAQLAPSINAFLDNVRIFPK